MAIEDFTNMNSIGAMFPYSGTVETHFKTFGNPLIATSGNFMVHNFLQQKKLNKFWKNCRLFLHNTLEIQHPQDDSVIKFSQNSPENYFRRSRGFAPNYFFAEELSELNKEKTRFCV